MNCIISIAEKHYKYIRMLLCLFILLTNTRIFGQINLVPNYSFEQYTNCPAPSLGLHEIKPDGWYKPDKGGGGYFDTCAGTNGYGVPFNMGSGTSFQFARTGSAYIAVYMMTNNGANTRNYFQVKLIDSLKKGNCYYAECFISLFNSQRLACNNQSILFTNTSVYVDTNAFPYIRILPTNPQITNYGNPIIADTLNWVKVSGIFIAQGGEQYLTIGNFRYDSLTDFKVIQATGIYAAAYYIDDVSVIPLDSMPLKADAGRDTTIKLGDSVFIGSLTNGLTGVVWYNSLGLPIANGIPGFYVTPLLSTFYVIEQTVCGYYSRDTVYVNVNPLPVTIVNYALRQAQGDNRQAQDDRVVNYWTTATEINVSHFNVQRSVNGKDFTTVGKVAANNKPSEYRFTDDRLPLTAGEVTLYYRLEIVDKDGTKTYSTIQHVNLSTHQQITISPNPTTGIVNIKLPATETGIKIIKISDAFGKEIQQLQTNETFISFHLKAASGMYFINITNQKTGNQLMQKIVVAQ